MLFMQVNIAIELVSQPAVLFMDEPTSSIDASSALNVAAIGRQLAHRQGITVVAVIHQVLCLLEPRALPWPPL